MKNKKRFGTRKEYVVAALVLAAAFGTMGRVAPWRAKAVKKVKAVVPVVTEAPKFRRAIDGMFVEKGKENPPLAGVMQENMIEAQPISGIADANLVFEAVTEANITRFLAYYTLDEAHVVPEIGPVRSARPYYLDWASEFNTLYGHVGSAPAAYALLRGKGVAGVQDLDQWYQSQYFERVNYRAAPHNVYTSAARLRKAYEKLVVSSQPPVVSQWHFKNDASLDLRGNVNEITVAYVAPYGVGWHYDKQQNQYTRMQWGTLSVPNAHAERGGGPHKDASGKIIMAKNIAVAFEDMKVLDEVGRKQFTTIGEGNGLVFQDGRVVVGTWKKPSALERMRWYDGQGNEVEFNAGVTWIEIVPKGYEVKY